MLSLDTLVLLRDVLAAQQLAAGSPDFAVTAQKVITALDELDIAIEAASERSGPHDSAT